MILCLCFNVRIFVSLSMMKRLNKLDRLPVSIQFGLLFENKARNLTKGGTPERYFIREGFVLTYKHETRLESLEEDKR
jgi:hypothetical protein